MSAQFLYVARYDLSAGHKFVLLFKEGDLFIPIPSVSNNPNWAVCVDTKGKIGYVPYTYVANKQVSKDELVWFIDDVLEKLHSDSPNSISKLTRDVISDLTRRRAELSEEISKGEDDFKQNKSDFIVTQNAAEENATEVEKAQQKVSVEKCQLTNFSVADSNGIKIESNKLDEVISKSSAENSIVTEDLDKSNVLPNNTEEAGTVLGKSVEQSSDVKSSVESGSVKKDFAESGSQTETVSSDIVPTWLVPTLIENVRCNTHLSHENSKTAIDVIINTFADALPHLSFIWCQLKENLDKSEVIQESTDNVVHSEDKRKLLDIFKQLWYCKNDEQQRSWPVHEDEELISTLLNDMNNILMDANPRVTREIVQCDGYEMVNMLVTYYQMEPRRTLRVKMLHVFLTLCELDLTVVTCLLNSVLPTELARDIQDNFEDEEKVQYSCYLLTVIFSTGEQPPRGTYDFINKKFLHFLFEKLEEVVKEGEEDMGQNLLNVVLAFNLHFQEGHDNLVLETLKERHSAQALTERLVFLLNREEDPSQILNHDYDTPNSVLKFMVDLFSNPSLFDLFYLNDIKVLLDIVVRQLSDLLPGEKKRFEYLMLVRNLLRNSNYGEHLHQVDGLRKCFKTVLAHEVPEEKEVEIILNIMQEFQCWFNGK